MALLLMTPGPLVIPLQVVWTLLRSPPPGHPPAQSSVPLTSSKPMASLLFENQPQSDFGSSGLKFHQLYQHIPILKPFYSEMEASFRAKPFVDFAKDTWPALPLAICGAYALMIVVGKAYMKNRAPFGWLNALAGWNLFLSLFSFCGMIRTAPHLVYNIVSQPFRDTICTTPEVAYGEGACGFWVMLFIFSKVPELVDTVFIVFRKKVRPSAGKKGRRQGSSAATDLTSSRGVALCSPSCSCTGTTTSPCCSSAGTRTPSPPPPASTSSP
jgi:hypothetical protein